MKSELIPQTEEGVKQLPNWVKVLFRFYAVIFLLGTIVAGVTLVNSFTSRSQELLTLVFDSMVSTSGSIAIALYAFALVILILQVIYGMSIFRFKRWVLPLVLIFSFCTLLVGFLRLVNQNFTDIFDLTGLLIGMTFTGVVAYVAIKYWSKFTGSAKKLLIQISLFLIFLPFILFAILSQIFLDDPQINDSDLVLQPVELLSQSMNAYYSLPDIKNLSVRQQQTYDVALAYAKELEDKKLNNQEAINLVNQTKGLTDAVLEASSKNGYQCPTLVNNYSLDAEVCSLNSIRNLAILTSFRAGVEADIGNKDQAISTAVSIVKLGSLIANTEQPLLIEHLVGIAVINIGLESLERTLNTSATTSNQLLSSAISNLEQSKIDSNSFANSLRREYAGLKDTLETFEQFSNYFYQHNKTVNQQAEIFRMGVAISSQGCDAVASLEHLEVDQLVEEIRLSPTKWPVISPNFIGKVFNSTVVASLSSGSEKACKVNEFNQRVQKLLQNNIAVNLAP